MSFSYYSLGIRLRENMLGSCPSSANIMKDHLIEKARKNIAVANRDHKKLLKSLKKFIGDDISAEKEIEELSGILRNQQEMLGVHEPIPTDVESILAYSESLEERLAEKLGEVEPAKTTIFLRDEEGHPCISSHVILGSVKAILAVITNGQKPEEKKSGIFKSKVALSEGMSLDLKPIESILMASTDILRESDGSPLLCVRPIRFNRMGVQTVALASSEQLPAGTEFKCTLRIRENSNLNNLATLQFIFDHGKSLGLGQHRSSSNAGQYDYNLKKLEDYKEVVKGEKEGWR